MLFETFSFFYFFSIERFLEELALLKMRRESRQKRVLKTQRTEEKRVTFLVNKQVCLQDPKSKKLNIQGVIRDMKVNARMI